MMLFKVWFKRKGSFVSSMPCICHRDLSAKNRGANDHVPRLRSLLTQDVLME
jgi:hypothetical protein